VLPDSAHSYGYGGSSTAPLTSFGQHQSQQTDRLTGGMTVDWRPTAWLSTHATAGVDHGSQSEQDYFLPQAYLLYYSQANAGQSAVGNIATDVYSADVRGSATAALTHGVRAVTSVGLQVADTRTNGLTATASGLAASSDLTLNGVVNPGVTQPKNRSGTLGGYAEEQLGFSERLFLIGAVRLDAGSGFGYSYQSAVYPKASISWLAVDQGPTTVRLRGAFGASGVQPHNGAALQLYAPATSWSHGAPTSGVTLTGPGNPALQPERTMEFEGGFDLALWGNRLNLEVSGGKRISARCETPGSKGM
jgi:hypothetical protein